MTRNERRDLRSWLSRYKHLLDFSLQPEYLRELSRAEQQAGESWEAFQNKYGSLVNPDAIVVSEAPPVYRRMAYEVMKYAAILIIILGAYFLLKQFLPEQKKVVTAAVRANDIEPGGYKAILTLADKSTIRLDSVKAGALAVQGETTISKNEEGRLVYQPVASAPQTDVYINELSTPRGGEYKLVLPDNSTVKLNAVSSLRYPSFFTGSERVVELLSGEAYFEITPNRSKPFKVKLKNGKIIEVLGTHFNVNTYGYKTNTTTLIKGLVKITSEDSGYLSTQNVKPGRENTATSFPGDILLKPNQQALTDSTGKTTVSNARPAEISQAISWVSDQFSFNETDFKTIIQQLQRWYDMDVVYETAFDNRKITLGPIPMNAKIVDVLDALMRLTKFNYRIEGKKLTLSD